LVGDILMNWIDSENYCQTFGGHLPSISNQSDLDYLRGFIVGIRNLKK
jgi:hypothetical protein